MKSTRKRARPAAGNRRPALRKPESVSLTAQFLRRTFCYLKGEQFLKMSNQLLCETA